MAYEIPILTHTLVSTGGSTSDQYKVVVATSSGGEGDGYAKVAVRGSKWTGILQEHSTEAAGMTIMSYGISKVAAGDSSAMENAITAGGWVVASSQGQAVPSTAVDLVALGQALESLSTGSTGVISVLLMPGARTTA